MLNSTQLSEMNSPNQIIKNIMIKMIGDKLFIFLSSILIIDVLYDNFELYKIFVYCIIKTHKSVKEYIIYKLKLDPKLDILLRTISKFKSPYNISFLEPLNFGFIFKAYAFVFQFGLEYNGTSLTFDFNYDQKRKLYYLREEDYFFLNYCFTDSLNPVWAENWKKAFTGFSKYILQDLYNPEKCERSLKILEKFLYLESIQKHISEEVYEELKTIIKDLVHIKAEACYTLVNKYISTWISASISSILRDSLKRLQLELKFD